mgnify:FL=1
MTERTLAQAEQKKGSVCLVGAGPGGLSLLTFAAQEKIASAEVIYYDRLINKDIIASLPKSAELIDVGKCGGNHPVPQHEINRLLGEAALCGKRVVRLKGGDPFVFGRGGEEMEYLRGLGIEVSFVPGITSGIAVPESVGIPVTHRGLSRSVTLVTGHEGGEGEIDWGWYAQCPGTLVIYMGTERLSEICRALIEGGMDAKRKLAVIEHGFAEDQKVSVLTVGDAALGVQRFSPPAISVIGDVAGLYEER